MTFEAARNTDCSDKRQDCSPHITPSLSDTENHFFRGCHQRKSEEPTHVSFGRAEDLYGADSCARDPRGRLNADMARFERDLASGDVARSLRDLNKLLADFCINMDSLSQNADSPRHPHRRRGNAQHPESPGGTPDRPTENPTTTPEEQSRRNPTTAPESSTQNPTTAPDTPSAQNPGDSAAQSNNPAVEAARTRGATLPQENLTAEINTLNAANIEKYLQPKAGRPVVTVGDGSQNQDAQLIQNALDNAQPGETIVLNGTFHTSQGLHLGSGHDNVSIIAGAKGAKILGEDSSSSDVYGSMFLSDSNNVTVAGITFDGQGQWKWDGIDGGTNITMNIVGNTIENVGMWGIKAGGSSTISGNFIDRTGVRWPGPETGFTPQEQEAIDVWGKGMHIENNVIKDSLGYPIQSWYNSSDNVIDNNYAVNDPNRTVRGAIMAGNGDGTAGKTTYSGGEVKGNTVVNVAPNEYAIEFANTDTQSVSRSGNTLIGQGAGVEIDYGFNDW